MIHSMSHDAFPEGVTDLFSREKEAEALVEAFLKIAEIWSLSTDETRVLLGSPGRRRFYNLRKGVASTIHALSDDEIDRLVYTTGIFSALESLFSPENSLRWLRNTAAPQEGYTRPWGNEAPLTYMLHGKMEGLSDVYRYVNGLRTTL